MGLTRSKIAVACGNRLFFLNLGLLFIYLFFYDLDYNCYDYDSVCYVYVVGFYLFLLSVLMLMGLSYF